MCYLDLAVLLTHAFRFYHWPIRMLQSCSLKSLFDASAVIKKCKTAQTAEGVLAFCISLVSLICVGLSESGDAGKPASFHLMQPHRPGQQRRSRMKISERTPEPLSCTNPTPHTHPTAYVSTCRQDRRALSSSLLCGK